MLIRVLRSRSRPPVFAGSASSGRRGSTPAMTITAAGSARSRAHDQGGWRTSSSSIASSSGPSESCRPRASPHPGHSVLRLAASDSRGGSVFNARRREEEVPFSCLVPSFHRRYQQLSTITPASDRPFCLVSRAWPTVVEGGMTRLTLELVDALRASCSRCSSATFGLRHDAGAAQHHRVSSIR